MSDDATDNRWNGLQRKTRLESKTPLKRNTPLRQKGTHRANRKVDREWAMIRKVVITRANSVCEAQLDRCNRLGAHVHHKKRRSQGGGNELANLMLVCDMCHMDIHMFPERSYKQGFLVRSYDTTPTEPKVAQSETKVVSKAETRYSSVDGREDPF